MRRIPISILLIVLSVFSFQINYAQDLKSLLNLVNSKDKKVVEKAISQIAEAGKLTNEANDLYNEALALQSNYELDEMTLQKKLASAEKKAVATQIKADKEYAAAYSSIYEICDRMLKESSVTYGETGGMESSAKEMIKQAKDKRSEAEDSKNPYEKAGLLNSAAELEGAAIDMLVMAVQVEAGVTPQTTTPAVEEDYTYTPSYTDTLTESPVTETYTPYSEPTTYTSSDYQPAIETKSDNLAINQQVIGKYDAYVNDPTIPEPVTLTRAGITGVHEASLDVAKGVIQGVQPVQEPVPAEYTNYEQHEMEPEYKPVVEEVEPATDYTEYVIEPEVAPEPNYVEDSYETADYSQPAEPVIEPEPIVEEQTYYEEPAYIPETSVTAVDGVNFRVQVAASKIPLTRSQVAAIYAGNNTIEVQYLGGWYKYNITGFRLFSDANRVALESGVKDAWVTAEHNGVNISLVEARNMVRTLETDVQRLGRKVLKNPIDFYVQLAASRIRIGSDELPARCAGGACREIIEEGWIKYQIYAGNNYAEAQQLKANISDEAFIVAYERGKKLNLYKAINKN